MSKPKTPTAPTYVPPAPYTQAPPVVTPPNPASVIPKAQTAAEIIGQANQIEGNGAGTSLPSNLQLPGNPLDPAGMQPYEQYYYQQYVLPAIAQGQANLYANGQNSGSYAGGYMGQLVSAGAGQEYSAGLQYAQQAYNDLLQGRQSYYAGAPALAAQQNALGVQQGNDVAGLQLQGANMQNQYAGNNNANLNTYNLTANNNQNQFGLTNYANTLKAYEAQNQARANQLYTLGNAGAGLLSSGPAQSFGSGLLSGLTGSGSSSTGTGSTGSSFGSGLLYGH
jgi:hypothetical protein